MAETIIAPPLAKAPKLAMQAVDRNATNADRLEAASMRLLHAIAMADVIDAVDLKDLPDATRQNFMHGLRDALDEAKDLVDAVASAALRDRVTSAQSSTRPNASARAAAMSATYEVSALADRIRAEVASANVNDGDEDIVICSHALRITQLGNALMTFVDTGNGGGLAEAGLVASRDPSSQAEASESSSARVSFAA